MGLLFIMRDTLNNLRCPHLPTIKDLANRYSNITDIQSISVYMIQLQLCLKTWYMFFSEKANHTQSFEVLPVPTDKKQMGMFQFQIVYLSSWDVIGMFDNDVMCDFLTSVTSNWAFIAGSS